MKPIVCALLLHVSTVIRSRLSLQLDIVALRHQLAVYQRTTKRPQISSGDRILWSWLLRCWSGWRDALLFVQTGTVIAYGSQFQQRVQSRDIEEVLTALRSPWQNAFVERIIGSIRRDCLDHVVVLNDRHLKRAL